MLTKSQIIKKFVFKKRCAASKLQPAQNSYKNFVIFNKTSILEPAYFLKLKKTLKKLKPNPSTINSRSLLLLNMNLNYPITRKSRNARMGKGRGKLFRWAVKCYRFATFLIFTKTSLQTAFKALTRLNAVTGGIFNIYVAEY